MYNARLLFDVLLAAVAVSAPFLRATPANRAVGMRAFISPLASTRRVARPRSTAKITSVAHALTYTVTATGYEAVPGQTDDEPFVTADNSRIKPHYGSKKRWMALSRDLLKPWGGAFAYGDKVRVRGISPQLDGVYTVHDTMNRRHRHCMDVLVHPSEHFDIFTKGVKIQAVVYKGVDAV